MYETRARIGSIEQEVRGKEKEEEEIPHNEEEEVPNNESKKGRILKIILNLVIKKVISLNCILREPKGSDWKLNYLRT